MSGFCSERTYKMRAINRSLSQIEIVGQLSADLGEGLLLACI